MLYFCSLVDTHTAEFLGAAFVNRETPVSASDAACLFLEPGRHVQIMVVEVPAGASAIPAIGRLLTPDELADLRAFTLAELEQRERA